MNSFPCRQLFIITRFFHSKYDPNLDRIKISKILLTYGALLTIFIQLYNVYQICVQFESVRSLLYKRSRLGNIVIYLDHSFWMIINWAHPITILKNRHKIVDCLNSFRDFEMILSHLPKFYKVSFVNNTERKIKIYVILCTLFASAVAPIAYYLSQFSSYSRLSFAFTLGFDLMFGHLFEFVFFETIRNHIKILRSSIDIREGHSKVWEWIALETRLWQLAKVGAVIFVKSKIVLLLSGNVLISIYWFYNYDLEINAVGSLIWQLFISAIFIVCFSWNQLANEVSLFNFFL